MRKAPVLLFVVFGAMIPAGLAFGHALEPGYLSIDQVEGGDFRIFWRRPDVGGAPMRLDLELPESCSPRRPPPPRFDGRAWISTFGSECVDGLSGGRITIHGLEATRTDVLVRHSIPGGKTLTQRLTPDRIEMVVPARPDRISVFASYFGLGFEHILEGWDHLLFVFALLLLIRDSWRLVGAVTAFTLAHSITLAGATLGWVSVRSAPVEATIALSIVFLASELARVTPGRHRLSERFPWLITFSFGLLHGLGFAGALTEIGLSLQPGCRSWSACLYCRHSCPRLAGQRHPESESIYAKRCYANWGCLCHWLRCQLLVDRAHCPSLGSEATASAVHAVGGEDLTPLQFLHRADFHGRVSSAAW
jgi:hypothetical protein